MDRRAYYFALAFITVFALAISVVLFPSFKTLSLMFYYDKQYDKSYDRYNMMYQEDDQSISVSLPLVWLNLEYANLDEAIFIMEEYVRQNPDVYDTREYLGELYKSTDRPHSYLSNLAELYMIRESAALLREQAAWYYFYGNIDLATEALQTIVSEFKPYQDEYIQLIYLYAAQGKEEKVFAVIDDALKQVPFVEMEPYLVYTFSKMLFHYGQKAKATDLAVSYAKARGDTKSSLIMVYQLNEQKSYTEAYALLKNIPADHQLDKEVVKATTTVLYDMGEETEAYHYLKSLFKKDDLTQSDMVNLLSLALMQEQDQQILADLYQDLNIQAIPEPILMAIPARAILDNNEEIVHHLFQPKNELYFSQNPIITLILKMSMDPHSDPKDYVVDMDKLTGRQKVLMAYFYYLKGYRKLAKETLYKLKDFRDVDEDQMYNLMGMFYEFKMVNRAESLLNDLRQYYRQDLNFLEGATLMLEAAKGNYADIEEWFKYNPDKSNDFLVELSKTATDYKLGQLGLITAELLVERRPTAYNKLLEANALIAVKRPEDALALLKTLDLEDLKAESIYLKALAGTARKYPEYRPQLNARLMTALEDPKLSQSAILELSHLYFKGGLREEGIHFLMEKAQDQEYESPYTQALIFAVRKNPPEKVIRWALGQAQKFAGYEKAKWLDYLVYMKHPELIFEAISEEDLLNEKIADLYISTAIELKMEERLHAALYLVIPRTQNMKRLFEYSKVALDEGLTPLAEYGLLKILDADPNHKKAIKELAILYVTEGQYCKAQAYLTLYMELYEPDYMVNYYYAETLWFYDQKPKAYRFYAVAQDQILGLKKQDVNSRMTLSQILFKFRYKDEALRIYALLVQENPENISLRADYANLLMDADRYHEAYCVIEETAMGKNREKELIYFEVTRARVYREVNLLCMAEDFGDLLLLDYPESAVVTNAKGQYEFYIERWRSALEWYDAALQIEPEHEGYARARFDILKYHNPFLATNFEFRSTSPNQREHFYRAFGSEVFDRYTSVTLEHAVDHIVLPGYVNPYNGSLSNFKGNRYKGTLDAAYVFEDQTTVHGLFFYGQGIYGGGLDATFYDPHGNWNVFAAYHQPNWDFAQLTVGRGTRDRLMSGRRQRFDKRLDGSAAFAYNQYNYPSMNNASSSVELMARMTFRLAADNYLVEMLGDDASLTMNYFIDGEYPVWQTKKYDQQGLPYYPLVLFKREEHTWAVGVNKRFSRYFYLEGMVGYLYDRFSVAKKPVPIGNVTLLFGDRPGFRAKLQYLHTVSVQSTAQVVDSYLAGVEYNF